MCRIVRAAAAVAYSTRRCRDAVAAVLTSTNLVCMNLHCNRYQNYAMSGMTAMPSAFLQVWGYHSRHSA